MKKSHFPNAQTRRDLFKSAAGLGVSSLFGQSVAAQTSISGDDSSETISIWPLKPPGAGGPTGPLRVSRTGAISNISTPALEVYRPKSPNGLAVLVAGGGGYKQIEVESEARPAARWLASHGVTAFVLSYRLPGEGWHDGPLSPLQDAQRALRLISGKSAQYGIDTNRIGVLGFSAGGHLLGLAASRSGFSSYSPTDNFDSESARPAQAALIYPIVTLLPPYDHTSTRVELVGPRPDPAQSAAWSVETYVDQHCPSLFLVQAVDDPISNIANTAILERAAESAGIPVERHVLPTGGHGFGMGQVGSPTGNWPSLYQAWLGLS